MNEQTGIEPPVWFDRTSCSLDDFKAHVEKITSPALVPLAQRIEKTIPIYSGAEVVDAFEDRNRSRAFMAEWNMVFTSGPGIIVVEGAYSDLSLIDQVTDVLNTIIAEEEASGNDGGDHFAAAGANSRVWNAHEKLCLASPELFARYNANPVIALASQSWLGPLYQITTQVNVVRPGGQAQQCHRDYHMGFQPIKELTEYPATVHGMSPLLTLQGGIVHCDMPVESGPTKLLPYSQTYRPGYLAAQMPEFRDYFEVHSVQLALKKGDLMFFNPATFHAAGENRSSDIDRIVNLMQIGSGYGRSIEIVDRVRMCLALYPTLRVMHANGEISASELHCIIAACAEGYPFPANLDLDSPLSGMAPESQQQLMQRAIENGLDNHEFEAAILDQQGRKRSH